MKQNRLLVNMKSKVESIDRQMEMLFSLMNGETIKLNGLHKMEIVAAKTEDAKEKNMEVLGKLQKERDSLVTRICRIDSSYWG